MEIHTCNQPSARFFHQAIVVITDIKQIIGLQIEFPSPLMPGQSGIRQTLGLVAVDMSVKVGIRTNTILPSDTDIEIEVSIWL